MDTVTKFSKLVDALGKAVDAEVAYLRDISDEQASFAVGDVVEWGGIEWTIRNLVPMSLSSVSFPQVQLIENGPRNRVRTAPRRLCTLLRRKP